MRGRSNKYSRALHAPGRGDPPPASRHAQRTVGQASGGRAALGAVKPYVTAPIVHAPSRTSPTRSSTDAQARCPRPSPSLGRLPKEVVGIVKVSPHPAFSTPSPAGRGQDKSKSEIYAPRAEHRLATAAGMSRGAAMGEVERAQPGESRPSAPYATKHNTKCQPRARRAHRHMTEPARPCTAIAGRRGLALLRAPPVRLRAVDAVEVMAEAEVLNDALRSSLFASRHREQTGDRHTHTTRRAQRRRRRDTLSNMPILS